MPFMRFAMTGTPRPDISKYIPSSHGIYYIVHIMDDIMRKNAYFKIIFKRHPFIRPISNTL